MERIRRNHYKTLNQRCVAALPFAGRYRLVDLHYQNAFWNYKCLYFSRW